MANATNNKTRLRYRTLTARRDVLGLTDQQIADRVGVKVSWWRGLLNGRCLADPDECASICSLLGVDPQDVPHRHYPETSNTAA